VASSVALAEGFVERPLVDEYVDLLFAAMRTLWPAIERRATDFRLRLTHDIDRPFAAFGLPAWRIARSLGADVVTRREPRLALHRLRAAADARRGRVDRDPSATFDFLMSTSERHGLRSTFYFLAGNDPGDQDYRYRLSDPQFAPILREINQRGHEIGLHASYISHGSAERTCGAAALVDACQAAGIDQSEWGVRQHYLGFSDPATWQHQQAAGLAHDSTMGFAEQVGFRSGTCRRAPGLRSSNVARFGAARASSHSHGREPLRLHGLSVEGATQRTREVVGACRRHDGTRRALSQRHRGGCATAGPVPGVAEDLAG
jgi:hypothetical protein